MPIALSPRRERKAGAVRIVGSFINHVDVKKPDATEGRKNVVPPEPQRNGSIAAPEPTIIHVTVVVGVKRYAGVPRIEEHFAWRPGIMCRIIIMSPDKAPIGNLRNQLDQPDRIGHMIEHATAKY